MIYRIDARMKSDGDSSLSEDDILMCLDSGEGNQKLGKPGIRLMKISAAKSGQSLRLMTSDLGSS